MKCCLCNNLALYKGGEKVFCKDHKAEALQEQHHAHADSVKKSLMIRNSSGRSAKNMAAGGSPHKTWHGFRRINPI